MQPPKIKNMFIYQNMGEKDWISSTLYGKKYKFKVFLFIMKIIN